MPMKAVISQVQACWELKWHHLVNPCFPLRQETVSQYNFQHLPIHNFTENWVTKCLQPNKGLTLFLALLHKSSLVVVWTFSHEKEKWKLWNQTPKQCFSTMGRFASLRHIRGVYRYFWFPQLGEGSAAQCFSQAPNGWRPRMPLNIP